jgi:hypothetical protein
MNLPELVSFGWPELREPWGVIVPDNNQLASDSSI